MPNLLLLSSNEPFSTDLIEQINLYAKDFTIFQEDDNKTFFDLIVLDDKPELSDKYSEKSAPVYLLLNAEEDLDKAGVNTINKPFSLRLFLDKLKSCIHFHENTEDGYLQFNGFELRPLRKEIYNQKNDETVKLTEKEVSIIKHLYKAQNKIVGKNELLQEVWGYSPDASTHTIETHIYRLRQKIEHDDPGMQFIITSEGGYQLNF